MANREAPVAHDVFISYASSDKPTADAACAMLEARGIRCWIAPRDVLPGRPYGEAIVDAIHDCRIMVVVLSSHANQSLHIPKEVERAVSRGVTILPFRIEDVTPGRSLDYFIGSVHWLDALTPPLEKHLEDLAETIRTLLRVDERNVPKPVAQPAATGLQPDVIPASLARSPSSAPLAPAPSPSKTTWAALAAVGLVAAVVVGVMRLRGGNDVPVPPSASPVPGVPAPAAPFPNGAVPANPDPIVGCYQWFNNAPVVIHGNGTMVAGPFTARWRRVNAAAHSYTFTWPEATDVVTLSPDQRTLGGANQYGFPTSGTRASGTSGLIGTWLWPNGVPVVVSPDGTFTAAVFRGRWRTNDAAGGIYALTWPEPVDSVTLSADGSRISGANQYGVPISGVRTEPCSAN
jgi:hypothetical protein